MTTTDNLRDSFWIGGKISDRNDRCVIFSLVSTDTHEVFEMMHEENHRFFVMLTEVFESMRSVAGPQRLGLRFSLNKNDASMLRLILS